MQMFTIVRTHNETGERMLCVGSSLVSKQPWWAVPGGESVTQPLMFRQREYAKWCADIAQRDDPLNAEHTYSVGEATL